MSDENLMSGRAIIAKYEYQEQVAREAFVGPIEQRVTVRTMHKLTEDQIAEICEKYKAPRSRVDIYVLDGLFYVLDNGQHP